MLHVAATIAVALLAQDSARTTDSAGDWPHWRGPNRDGVSPETGWLSGGAKKALWSAQVGIGYSSPSISDGRLFTRGFFAEDSVDLTTCLDAETGEELWVHAAPAKLWDNMHGGGTLTTPIVDGDVVYVLSRMGPLMALSAETGDVLWERELGTELEIEVEPFGLSSSPLLLGDVLFVNVGKTVALDKRSGKLLWETRDYGYSYATPEPFELDGRSLLAVFNGAGLTILEQETGKEVALHPWTSEYNVNSASPIVVGNRFFISTGYNELGGALLELKGDTFELVWSSKRMNTKMNGCVLVDGLLYGFDDAVLRCLDLEGEEQWSERGLGKGTVIASDGRLIVLSEEGELLIAPTGSESFEPTDRTQVFDGGVCWTTPVLANGLLYLRSSTGELVCRDHRAAE